MHDFMRAVGFRQVKDKNEYQKILKAVLDEPTEVFMSPCSIRSSFGGMAKEYAPGLGIMAFGHFNWEADLEAEFYLPYLKGSTPTLTEFISIEKQADKDSYMGVCDDVDLGISLIFQLLNMKDYIEYSIANGGAFRKMPVTLSGLALSGKIIFPVMHEAKHREQRRIETAHRSQMLTAARQGNKDAIENLMIEDMDLYTEISKRAKNEDVLSIVDSYIMPYGIAGDQYSIMGNILDVTLVENQCTGEELYRMTLECHDFVFDICINCQDLLGEPAVGRRFKGDVWLQGIVDFSGNGL